MKITDKGDPLFNKSVLNDYSSDVDMKKTLKALGKDILEHSYAGLIETIFGELQNNNQEMLEKNDVYTYIKITAFFISLFRRLSYEKYDEEKKTKGGSARLQLSLA
jgi:hypothetical protein